MTLSSKNNQKFRQKYYSSLHALIPQPQHDDRCIIAPAVWLMPTTGCVLCIANPKPLASDPYLGLFFKKMLRNRLRVLLSINMAPICYITHAMWRMTHVMLHHPCHMMHGLMWCMDSCDAWAQDPYTASSQIANDVCFCRTTQQWCSKQACLEGADLRRMHLMPVRWPVFVYIIITVITIITTGTNITIFFQILLSLH